MQGNEGCAEHVALKNHTIDFFDYQASQDDCFFEISKKMIASDVVVFATPVYWYAMSAQMKVFFDRLSDLISKRKEDGRALKGREVYLLVNGTGRDIPEGFVVPFARTSQYFDMIFKDTHYVYTHTDEALKKETWDKLLEFKKDIFADE